MAQQRRHKAYFFTATLVALCLATSACVTIHPPARVMPVERTAAAFEVVFSPSRKAEDAIVRFIGEARKSVHVAAYAFTSKEIALALLAAKDRGLDVRIVVDKSQAAGRYSAATFLANHAVAVRVDGEYQLQHQKVVIVDGVSIETGSYNFTASARDRNSENVLIIRDAPELAARYEANWEKMWGESVMMERRY